MTLKIFASLLTLFVIAGTSLANGEQAGKYEAADAALQQWRREKAGLLWLKLNSETEPMPPAKLAAAVRGDFFGLYDPDVDRSAYIVSGTPDIPMSPAAMLMLGYDGQFWPHCSAVLTRPDTLLTAAHCLRYRTAGAAWKVFVPYEGIRDVPTDGVTLPCDDKSNACRDDLAIIRLAVPYSFAPLAGRASRDQAHNGSIATTLSFGAANEMLLDQGLGHGGTVVLDACGCGDVYEQKKHLLCFEFDYGKRSQGFGNYIGRTGDSGGPLFAGPGPTLLLMGIAAGVEKSCGGRDVMEGRYTDVSVLGDEPWLIEAFCRPDCRSKQLPNVRVLLRVDLAYADSSNQASHEIMVDRNAVDLIVNMNHETGGFQPEPVTDLSIVMPATLEGECSRYYGVESCHVSNPPPGAYSIGIQRESGNPAYQLTVVAIYEE